MVVTQTNAPPIIPISVEREYNISHCLGSRIPQHTGGGGRSTRDVHPARDVREYRTSKRFSKTFQELIHGYHGSNRAFVLR